MSALWALLGVAVLALAAVDVVLTTLGAGERTGPVSGLATRGLWRLFLRLHRRRGATTLMRYAGPAMLVLALTLWVVLLWLGWTLVFAAGQPAIEHSTTGRPGDVAQVAYYAGFAVFTLGVGDYVATTDLWRLLTVVASFSGLFLVTLAITYLLNVLSAVIQRRSLAQQVHAMGGTPGEILRSGWDGQAFTWTSLQQLNDLAAPLAQTTEQQLAYPVLAYFHTRREAATLPPALAALDDAMLLLDKAVEPSVRPADVPQTLRSLTDQLRATSALAQLGTAPEAPPAPDVTALRQSGVPLRPEAEIRAVVAADADRRRHTLALVEGSGHRWPHG